jgi:hypothetical protein
MKKIALCFGGEYRTFDNEIVQNSLKHFICNQNLCDIYISIWDHRGTSLNHGNPLKTEKETERIKEKHITDYFPNAVIEIENYEQWKNSLNKKHAQMMQENTLHKNCISQLYKKHKAHKLIPQNKEYDFVINTRPDLFYFQNFDFNEYVKQKNTIWNFNPENKWAYYPNRIFDILYMGQKESVEKMAECYFNIDNLLNDPYNSNLHKIDCCKMLYIHAKNCKLEVKSTHDILANVYRDHSSIEYNLKNCNINEKDFLTKITV